MKRALRAPGQVGFTLLPVILAMTLIAAVAFLINRDNGMNANMISAQSDLDRARYAAEAGLQAVNYQVQNTGCSGGFPISTAPVTNSNFGGASYSAYADHPTGNSLTLTSTGSYNGASVTLSRANVTVFDNSSMQTVTLQRGGAGNVYDTWASGAHKTTDYGASTNMQITLSNAYPLVQFDLSSLPAGSRVIPYYSGGALQPGAQFGLYQSSAPPGASGSMSIDRMTQGWVEGTGNGTTTNDGANWNTYDGVNSWSGTGPSFDSRPVSSNTLSPSSGWYYWDLTDLVVAWMDGVYPNYGLTMAASSGIGGSVTYVSSDDSVNVAWRPKLALTYIAPCAATTTVTLTPVQDTWIDASAGGNSNYGGATSLTVTNAGKPGRALLRFDLSSIPPFTLLKSATLRLWATSVSPQAASNLTVNTVFDTWVEGTQTGSGSADGATWKTRDGSNAWSGGNGVYWGTGSGAPTTTTAIDSAFSSGWVEWDVSGVAQQWLNLFPNYGVGVMIDTSSVVTFNSREAASLQPQLVISY